MSKDYYGKRAGSVIYKPDFVHFLRDSFSAGPLLNIDKITNSKWMSTLMKLVRGVEVVTLRILITPGILK